VRSGLVEVGALARRSMRKTVRQPFQLFPIVFFPAILLAVNASGLKPATRLPGFPTHSYVSFAIAIAFIQGGMFSMINTGTNLAQDIESGFFSRLALTPLRRGSLLSGFLVGVAVIGAMQSLVYLLLGVLAGAELQAGLASCLLGRESRGEILSRLHLQMRLQFRLEFFVHLTTEEQCAQPKKSVLPPPHIKPSLTPGQWRQ